MSSSLHSFQFVYTVFLVGDLCIISLTENGHYVYVEARWEDEPANATLYLAVRERHCLRFWYYMFGELTPSLVAGTQTRSATELIFQRTDSQGDYWHPAIIDLELKNEEYNVS